MKSQLIMNDWTFAPGLTDRFATPQKQPVDLPHDMQVGLDQTPQATPASGFFPGCAGTYEKFLEIPQEWEGEKVFAAFDGVYMQATISLNGSRLESHPYGYTPFVVDLTRRVRFGERNRLVVAVDNTQTPNCRWYSGAGIYRDVKLLHGPLCRIQHKGIYLVTESLDKDTATIAAQIRVVNDGALPFHGHVDLTLTAPDGSKTQGRTSVWVEPGEEVPARLRMVVETPQPWNVDTPALYTAQADLTPVEGADGPVDSDSTNFGIRTVQVDAVHGLRINGATVKLKGGCIHHTTSPLGAADFDDQTRRVLTAHKEAGYNALRMAHNPPSERFLDLCDQYGLLVLDEAFDGWHVEKTPYGYHQYFDQWWEKDVESFVLRDRNHPSVILWSVGNEVFERAGAGDGYLVARRLAEKVRSLDSSRPVMLALCTLWNGLDDKDAAELQRRSAGAAAGQNGELEYTSEIWASRTESIASPLDVVGYNYMEDRYLSDHQLFPHRVICGTESFPMAIDQVWALVEQCPYVIGDFTWTSADYIGEAGIGGVDYVDPSTPEPPYIDHNSRIYPWKLAYDADWDILNQPRPQLAYRRIVWGSPETYLAVRDPGVYGKKELISRWAWPRVWNSWTYPGFEGKPIQIDVYSPGDSVELFLNGKSLGVEKPSRFTAKFETIYQPGVLEAVSYRNGEELSRDRVETVGKPVKLVLRPEQTTAAAGGQSLFFVMAEFQDQEGRRVPGVSLPLAASVEGAASLLSFASANPLTDENYESGTITSFDGRAMAILRTGKTSGKAVLTVTCPGYEPACQELEVR
ncbi:MAG: glycoside hydrolase family 2 protein [Acutalibacter sp.]|jgi:beta-galactosidase